MDKPNNTKEEDPSSNDITVDSDEQSTTATHQPASSPVNPIEPPPSKLELARDRCLEIVGGDVQNWIALVVLILIVIDGAFFFFLLIGAHNMCNTPSRTNCNPRNYWYNFSIQFLNVLFTYMAIVSLPWKLAHAEHLTTKRRSSEVGLDLYGQPCDEIWYHISPKRRRWIVGFLIANSLTQYANQVTRVVYYSYDLQATFPGILWTNLFFVASFSCALGAGIFQLYEETLLRKSYPDKFPPGPVDCAKKYVQGVICSSGSSTDSSRVEDSDDLENPKPLPEREERERKRFLRRARDWFLSDRTSLGMWGLPNKFRHVQG